MSDAHHGNAGPNLLIVVSDQLRRDALRVYGDPNISTPNIDRLAERGTRFTQASSTYPVCVPFRYTLMTGHYAHRCMIPCLGWRMSPAERTLADELNDGGYETAYFGKWHLYGGQVGVPGYSPREENSKPVPRTHQGRWKYWRGFELANAPFETDYFIDGDPTPHRIDGYQTDGLTSLLLDYLEGGRDPDRPFCALLSVEPPHPPFKAPKELEERWLSTDIALPPSFMKKADGPGVQAHLGNYAVDESAAERVIRDRRIYYAMVENLDMNLGRIVQGLQDAGLYDDTIIVLMSDHGEMGGVHGAWAKLEPYEESIGIPLIIAGPGIPEARLDVPVSSEDLFPSILGLAGLDPATGTDGCNLAPLIRSGGEDSRPDRPGVLLELIWQRLPQGKFYHQLWRGFRSERYKYTVLGDLEQGLKPWQLFDLEKDPYEMENLIDHRDMRDIVSTHHRWMTARMTEVGDDAILLLAER